MSNIVDIHITESGVEFWCLCACQDVSLNSKLIYLNQTCWAQKAGTHKVNHLILGVKTWLLSRSGQVSRVRTNVRINNVLVKIKFRANLQGTNASQHDFSKVTKRNLSV